MRMKINTAHFTDGTSVVGNIRSSVGVSAAGGTFKVDEIEATPVGLVVRLGAMASLVPWGSVKSCPSVEVLSEDKPKAGK